MRNFIFSILIALLSLPAVAQQQPQAQLILDKTVDAFRKAGSVEANFVVKAVTNGRTEGEEQGTIRLKGDKFVLKTSGVVTWFDGKTQWSYVSKNDEVNISTPTQAELQTMNPYALLSVCRKGFACRLGTTKTFLGKNVWELQLTAKEKSQEMEAVTLYVAKESNEPLFIRIKHRGQQTRSEITITGYATHRNYEDAFFAFDRKQYPTAEVIDLR